MGMVGQAVERRVRHDRVGEQTHPVLRRPVARDDNGRSEMALRDDLVDVLRLDGRERGKPKIVDDQKIGVKVLLDLSLPGLIGARRKEVPEHLDRLHKKDAVASPACLVTERLRNVGLPDARGAVDQDMLPLLDKETRGEIGNCPSSDLRVEGEVEALQCLLFFEGRLLYPHREPLRLPSFYLVLYDEGKEGEIREFVFFGLRHSELEGLPKPSELELPQIGHEVVINHGAPPR